MYHETALADAALLKMHSSVQKLHPLRSFGIFQSDFFAFTYIKRLDLRRRAWYIIDYLSDERSFFVRAFCAAGRDPVPIQGGKCPHRNADK